MDIQDAVLAKIANTMGVAEETLTLDTKFDTLGADSLDMVEFSMDIEEEFGVVIEQSDIAAISTIGDAIEFINKKKT